MKGRLLRGVEEIGLNADHSHDEEEHRYRRPLPPEEKQADKKEEKGVH